MPGFSQNLFLVSTLLEVATAIPVGMVLKRLGISPWWALICLIPVAAIVALWMLAFMRWPRDGRTQP